MSLNPVYMFVEIGLYVLAHVVENEVYSLAPCQLCRRNKIAVARNKDYLIYLFLYAKEAMSIPIFISTPF